jgi:predicted enzyme related to lactoylglutathione lyase
MSRGIHFELPADNPERAVKFYQDVLGWKINKWGPVDYWLAITGTDTEPGIDGAIMRRAERVESGRSKGPVITFSVDSVDNCSAAIIRAGGKVIKPKTAIPGVGYHAYCTDPEGNEFGILEEDHSATWQE